MRLVVTAKICAARAEHEHAVGGAGERSPVARGKAEAPGNEDIAGPKRARGALPFIADDGLGEEATIGERICDRRLGPEGQHGPIVAYPGHAVEACRGDIAEALAPFVLLADIGL